jgi:exopolysaccharide production protein ExoQ
MPPEIAAVAYGIGILVLFLLNRDEDSRTSKALWIPVMWLLIIGSRPVSQWLNIAPATTSPDQYLDGSPLDRAVFAVLLAIGLIVLFTRQRRVATFLGSNWPILLFFAYCALSTAWSDYPDVAFKRWIKALGDLVMVLIVLTDTDPSAATRRLLDRVGLILLPVSVLFIKYFPNLGRAYTPEFGYWQPMYIGVSVNKNSLGGVALVVGLGAVWQFTELFHDKGAPNRGRRVFVQGTTLAIVSWIFWTANSVTSLSCFLLGAAVLLITGAQPRFRRPAVVHTLILAVLCSSVFAIFIAPNLVSILGRDPTLTGRTQVWNVVLNMPVNRLIGTGFESFWLGERMQRIWNLWWWHPNEAHNGYIEVLLNLGWIGLSLLALFLITGYRKIISTLRAVSIARLGLAYFVVAIVYSFTEAGFRMLGVIWIFLVLAITAAGVPIVEAQTETAGQYEIDALGDALPVGSDVWSDPELESF